MSAEQDITRILTAAEAWLVALMRLAVSAPLMGNQAKLIDQTKRAREELVAALAKLGEGLDQ